MATAGTDAAVRLWEVATGKQKAQFDQEYVFGAGPISYSPDGRWLAVSQRMGDNTVFLLSADTGQLVRVFWGEAAASYAIAFAFHPNGLELALAGEVVEVWDLETGEMRQQFPTSATALAYSPDGRVLATSDSTNTLTLWDTRTGEALITLSGHRASITALYFSPDGHTLVSTSSDGTSRIWQVLEP